MTSKTDNTDLSALTGALDDTAAPIRELNEKVIAAAKRSGTQSLDAYEKTLASLLSFGEKVAGATQLDWVLALGQGARDVGHRNDGGVHRGGQGRTQIRTDH